ncbi:MAG: tetratricopeptide repeat protein [Deltaproteobacteria bacterium]|nr:tetratricopeptide repeat protein [Deltaproteobacteria bacterium]MBN2672191.1 tetratricopeptide repeat protein [Deltaproteobacteria bacterium]
MRKLSAIVLLLGGLSVFISCGPAQISEESIRKSNQFYDAAYVSWRDQNDTLTAIRHLTRAVDANPENDDAQYLLGTIRLSRGEYEEAEIHLLAAVKYRQNNASKKVEAQNSLAVLYIHTKRYQEAVVLLEEASKEVLNRAPWLAYGNLGWAYTELGEYDKAIAAVKRALFDQPQFCVGLYRLGNAYYQKGEFDAAREALNEAVSIEAGGCDRMQEAFHLLGMVYLRLDSADDAMNAFNTCVEINPKTELGISCSNVTEED